MHWGKERGSMNERAWERESENSWTLPSFQAANLCLQSTLWQRHACENINPSREFVFASNPPGITHREQEGRTPRSRGAASSGDTWGLPPCHPCLSIVLKGGCPAYLGVPEDKKTCLFLPVHRPKRTSKFSHGCTCRR